MLYMHKYTTHIKNVTISKDLQKQRLMNRINANTFIQKEGDFFKLYDETVFNNKPGTINHNDLKKYMGNKAIII